jgi:hypothetical protein
MKMTVIFAVLATQGVVNGTHLQCAQKHQCDLFVTIVHPLIHTLPKSDFVLMQRDCHTAPLENSYRRTQQIRVTKTFRTCSSLSQKRPILVYSAPLEFQPFLPQR